MVNTVTNQILNDGERNLIVKVQISGDGSGEESARLLIDVSTFANAPGEVKIRRITGDLVGFSAQLLWDADIDVKIVDLNSTGEIDLNYTRFGGLINDAGSGKTGDIMLTTSGLGSGDEGTIILEMWKRGV